MGTTGVRFGIADRAASGTLGVVPADDRAVFAEWVRPHWPVMHRLARRIAPPGRADDAVQEALAAAWRKRDQFDETRGSARVWLLAVVADQARKQHRGLAHSIELRDDVADTAGTVVVIAPDGAVADRVDLDSALVRLTDRQRTAVDLHYYLGLPLADIAAVMGCSTGTVKSTLADARRRLRALLGEDYR